MKKKTRDFVANLERACESARKIPPCCAATGPDHDLVTALWRERDKWLSATTRRLPEYHVPETASIFARAQSWPDCEAAYRLPDNRLLVLWCDFTLPEVMTEAEYLHRLATRCVDLAQADEGIKRDVLAFRSATRNPA